MNKEIEPIIINLTVYFESKYMDTISFNNDIQYCIDKLKTNDVYCQYNTIDSFISWMNDNNYQYKVLLEIKIMPYINIDNYYINKQNPNYHITAFILDKFIKYFLLMFFTTNNIAPYYFEDTKVNIDVNIEDMYLYSEELAKCDQQYLYNYLMSDDFINICQKYYYNHNNIYEPIIAKLIDEHSISLNDYINDNNQIHKLGDRRVILLE